MYSTIVSILSILVIYFELSLAQLVVSGKCPNPKPVQHFSIKRYSGRWYEWSKYKFIPEIVASCVKVTYGEENHDGTFGVEIAQLEHVGLHTKPFINTGLTHLVGKHGEGSFVLDFYLAQIPKTVMKYPYLVLDTDYDHFTVKWRCIQLGPYNIQALWILSREKHLSQHHQDRIHDTLRKMGLSVENLQKSDLSTCHLYGESEYDDHHQNNHGDHQNNHGDHQNNHGDHQNNHGDHPNNHGDHQSNHNEHGNWANPVPVKSLEV